VVQQPGDNSIEERVIGGTRYRRYEDSHTLADFGLSTHWLGAVSPCARGSHDAVPSAGVASMSVLTSITAVRDLGSTAVSGTSATHFTGAIPADRVLDCLSSSVRRELLLGTPASAVTASIDYWTDRQDRIVRVTLTLHVGDAKTVIQRTLSATMNLSEFGTPADITTPPRTDVTWVSDLANWQQEVAARGLGHNSAQPPPVQPVADAQTRARNAAAAEASPCSLWSLPEVSKELGITFRAEGATVDPPQHVSPPEQEAYGYCHYDGHANYKSMREITAPYINLRFFHYQSSANVQHKCHSGTDALGSTYCVPDAGAGGELTPATAELAWACVNRAHTLIVSVDGEISPVLSDQQQAAILTSLCNRI